MNNAIAGLIDDAFIEDAAQMRLQCESAHSIRKKRSVLIAALAACLVLALAAVLPFAFKKNNDLAVRYYSLSDLNAYEEYGMYCFRGFLGLPEGEYYCAPLTEDDIKALFGVSELPDGLIFGDPEESLAVCHVALYRSGGVYEIYLRWARGDADAVEVVINPCHIPDYETSDGDRLLSGSGAETVNGYTVGIQEYYADSIKDYICICMAKDGIGIRIRGKNEYFADIEAVYNLVLNSEINCEFPKK